MFLTVLHRLFVSGSDRAADRWREDYAIAGVDELDRSTCITSSRQSVIKNPQIYLFLNIFAQNQWATGNLADLPWKF